MGLGQFRGGFWFSVLFFAFQGLGVGFSAICFSNGPFFVEVGFRMRIQNQV